MVGARITTTRAPARRLLLGRARSFVRGVRRSPGDGYLLENTQRLPTLIVAWHALTAGDRSGTTRGRGRGARILGSHRPRRLVPATLFCSSADVRPGEPRRAAGLLATLADVLSVLEGSGGRGKCRGATSAAATCRGGRPGTAPAFSDDRPSLPIAGATTWAGTVNVFAAPRPAGSRRRYGVSGRANTAVVEFGTPVRAQSITPFGTSTDSSSPHFFDQAPLYAAGGLKPMWFDRAELAGNTERAYHPGDRR
jgi:hypothetical protein